MFSAQAQDDEAAESYLEKVVTSDQGLPDALMTKYAPGGHYNASLTPSATASPSSRATCSA
jgi:hypothetical protein